MMYFYTETFTTSEVIHSNDKFVCCLLKIKLSKGAKKKCI